MSKVIKIFALALCFLVSIASTAFANEGTTTIRAALDIGSGATKLRVAEVDIKSHKIVKVLETKSYSIPYQQQLSESLDGTFNNEVMEKGMAALKESVETAKKYGAGKVIAVATAAFRKANNSDAYIQKIFNETGIRVHLIDQGLEGELAFKAVQSHYGISSDHLVVWDIGGGSMQLTSFDCDDELYIYRGHEASTPFKDFVIEKIQNRKIVQSHSPNPLNVKEILQANAHAQRVSQKVDAVIKKKIKNPNTVVVGVGNIFGYQLAKMFNYQSHFSRDQLVGAVANLAGKSDDDVGGGDFANVFVTNAALILGFMEGLEINKMEICDINPADGAFFYSPFWNN